jgi:hypothetical protein
MEPFERKFIGESHSYPHVAKIHKNLYCIMAISESFFNIENHLKKKHILPKGSGFVMPYPAVCDIQKNYAALLMELLTETTVFIRGHDDYWKNKDGNGWSGILKRKCGRLFGEKDNEEALTLREACNKIIHHDSYDLGSLGTDRKFTVYLFGKRQQKAWRCELDVTEFCLVGITYLR